MAAAKEAGFTYVVLTAKHHSGFANWPSKFGEFNTKNYMGGRDLVKEYVEACRKHGLKVGLYYSPPDWYFDRDYMSFLYGGARKKNPELPNLGPDLKPREVKYSPEEKAAHERAFVEYVNGQVEELLTNYGKIDLMWFDGKPAVSSDAAKGIISRERIRQLQPGIVINPRLHGVGDFITYERTLKTDQVHNGWAEFCNTWASNWSYVKQPMRSNAFILGQLARSRSLGINYLLGIGPMSSGELSDDAYKNMGIVAQWMKTNGESIRGTKPLPKGEKASVPAVAQGGTRYLFAIPQFKGGGMMDKDQLPPADEVLKIDGVPPGGPSSVLLLGDGNGLKYYRNGNSIRIEVPAARRCQLVDVVKIAG
jgi:alpha-L-fucosidase